MKYITVAAAIMLVCGTAVTAHAQTARTLDDAVQPAKAAPVVEAAAARPSGETQAALDTVGGAWDRAAFDSPSKPSQYRVYGRNGFVTSGPQYNAMVESIREAVSDVDRGRDHAAAIHIDRAQELLTDSAPSERMLASR
jgi:hypothetical protein